MKHMQLQPVLGEDGQPLMVKLKKKEEASEEELIGRAIHNMREVLAKTMQEEGIDGAWFSLRIEVREMSSNFKDVLATYTFDDAEYKVKEDD